MTARQRRGGCISLLERVRDAQAALSEALDPHDAALLILRLMYHTFLCKNGLLPEETSPFSPPAPVGAGGPLAADGVRSVLNRLRSCFDDFTWYLDDRPPPAANEVTPATLAEVFDALVNEGQPGAYSTGPDVAAHICRSTVLPCLLERVQALYPAVLAPDGPLLTALRRDPDRYLFPDATHGTALPLPPEIAAGVHDVGRRALWDTPAPSDHALPGETWREVVARRERYEETRARLVSGAVRDAADLVTLHLDAHRLLLDVLSTATDDDPLLRRAFGVALQQITVLDPACGSGAFLLAALDVLEPLYAACFDGGPHLLPGTLPLPIRGEGGGVQHPAPHTGNGTGDEGTSVPGVRAAVLTRNLYGVDILPAAVEAARLRFLLRLAAPCRTAAEFAAVAHLSLNLCVGNALVGRDFSAARDDTAAPKSSGSAHQPAGNAARVSTSLPAAAGKDTPLDWPDAFPEVARRGGFDVVLGNPPFVETTDPSIGYRRQLGGYATLRCGNLYPLVVERGRSLLRPGGWLGMILPLAAFSTRTMTPFLEGVQAWFPQTWISFYHFRPAMLFAGRRAASIPTAIAIGRAAGSPARWSTGVRKWPAVQRASLFTTLAYTAVAGLPCAAAPHAYPKLSHPIENGILRKLAAHPPVRRYLAPEENDNTIYYRTAGGLYWKVVVNFPWPYQTTSNKQCCFRREYQREVFVALFNSSLFWWYYTVTFDTLNLKDYLLFGFPFTYPDAPEIREQLCTGAQELMASYRAGAAHLRRGATGSYTIYARNAKHILDEIDRVLAAHYGLTDEELDFIMSYDLKHRMGSSPQGGKR